MRKKVYFAKGWKGKREDQLTEEERVFEFQPDDEYIEIGEYFTYLSILKEVAGRMGYTPKDFSTDEEVETFLSDFHSLSREDRIRYGVWEEGTPEREEQKRMGVR